MCLGLCRRQMVYTVEVTATDNRDGTLSITPTYKIGKNVVPGISFSKTYEASGSLMLTASKIACRCIKTLL